MPAVFSLPDLYLYPSNLEAFPIPLTEAMACGTPILTSNVNGLKEIAGDAALLIDPRDTESIANGMTQILSDSELCESLSRKGLERSSLFSWDLCAKSTLALLEKSCRQLILMQNLDLQLLTGTIVIVAPHMDDEALACGGLIAKLPHKDRIHIIYATDGMKSPAPIIPGRDKISPDLGKIRMQESIEAMKLLGVPEQNLHFLCLPEAQLTKDTFRP